MIISLSDLKIKMPELTGLLFTHPEPRDYRASEIWIKFRAYGVYAYINFEQPFPSSMHIEKLVGSGNALNCNEYKKNELIQYTEKNQVIDILEKSVSYRGNIEDTVKQVKDLFVGFTDIHLYYLT